MSSQAKAMRSKKRKKITLKQKFPASLRGIFEFLKQGFFLSKD